MEEVFARSELPNYFKYVTYATKWDAEGRYSE